MRRAPPWRLLLLLVGCALGTGCADSHGAHAMGDASLGAPDAGPFEGPPRLAAPCAERVDEPRVVELSAGVVEAAPGVRWPSVAGLAARSEGVLLLVAGLGRSPEEPGDWRAVDVGLDASVRASTVLDPDCCPVLSAGTALTLPGGDTLLGWESALRSGEGIVRELRVSLAVLSDLGVSRPRAPVHIGPPALSSGADALVLAAAGGRTVLVIGHFGSIVVSDLDDHELARVDTPEETDQLGWFRAAFLDERRLVLLRRQASGPTWAAVVNVDTGHVDARATVAPPTVTARSPSLLVHGGSIYVAYFDEVLDDLWAGRLRVARLDAGLRRMEPDRAVTGWGGLAPIAARLLLWRSRPWLAWLTLDGRYGGRRVLYAVPLRDTPCLRAVPQPIGILRAAGRLNEEVRLGISGDELWLAFGIDDQLEVRRYGMESP